MGRLISCIYCGQVHKTDFICRQKQEIIKRRQSKDKDNEINRFHWSSQWRRKSLEIRQRDKYLCQWCLNNNRIEFEDLSVHHIRELSCEEGWERRLDNDNLITLCRYCHELAESGEIKKEQLFDILRKYKTD